MKIVAVISMALLSCIIASGQRWLESANAIKISAGYARDFPGLSGYGVMGEYSHSLSAFLDGGIAFKHIDMNGYPRSATVKEYTKSNSIDFNLFFVPLLTDKNILRIGAGYSFSFYKTRRSYPVINTQGIEKITSWPVQDAKGRSSGVIVSGEYEYLLSSDLSLGIKISLCKAYDRVFYVGPFVAIKL